MIRDRHSFGNSTHNYDANSDQKDIERSFSSQNIHQDIVHLMIGQHSSNRANTKILRMPTGKVKFIINISSSLLTLISSLFMLSISSCFRCYPTVGQNNSHQQT